MNDGGDAGSPFPGRISRKLGLAVGAGFLLILLVGGISSIYSRSILQSTTEVNTERHHVEATDQIHALIHHLIREVDRAILQRTLDRRPHIDTLREETATSIGTFLEEHLREEEPFPEKEEEIRLIRRVEALFGELYVLIPDILDRIEAGAPPRPKDLELLDAVAHRTPELVSALNDVHHRKASREIDRAVRRMRFILVAYVAFLVVGTLGVAAGILVFTRTISAPLRRLAAATLGIARGDFGKRLSISSRDEIGQLSHAFNVMAERLERREAELQEVHHVLERKVEETQALHRIGMEISSDLSLDRILQSVAEKARILLESQGAALCLFRGTGEPLELAAFSGPVQAANPVLKDGFPICLMQPEGCLCPGSESCGSCMLLEGRAPGASLAAPLVRGERIIGALCVGRRQARAYAPEDRDLLTGLAAQAAIAIENARLYGEVRGVATLDERERIAREMHDGLAQTLGYLHMRLGALASDGPPEEVRQNLREMQRVAGGAYEEVRQAIFGLRTMVSRGLGLVPTLTEYLHEFSAQHGLQVDLQVGGEGPPRLSVTVETQLVRIIQEALTNVRKHAAATRAIVRLEQDGEWCCATVRDDGRGFDPAGPAGPGHFGIQTMRERAEGAGGTLEVRSRPGEGTEVRVQVPGGAQR